MRRRLERYRILFMGGNLLGCLCLKELLRMRRVEISSVVGRYNDNGSVVEPQVWNASLLRLAAQKGLPFLQPKSAKDKHFLKLIYHQQKPDYILSIQYDKILGPELVHFPKEGCINIHYALLPHNRGCLPIPWALIDNAPMGVTMHWMDESIDTGDIIAAQKMNVSPEDTAQTLYFKATNSAFQLFKKMLPLVLEKKAPRIKQPQNGYTYHTEGYPFDRIIDWEWSADKINRVVRALTFPPFPGARTFFRDLEVEILYPVKVVSHRRNGYQPGQIVDITPNGMTVQSKHDCVIIPKVRINQSLVMDAAKFCRQFKLNVGDLFEAKSELCLQLNT